MSKKLFQKIIWVEMGKEKYYGYTSLGAIVIVQHLEKEKDGIKFIGMKETFCRVTVKSYYDKCSCVYRTHIDPNKTKCSNLCKFFENERWHWAIEIPPCIRNYCDHIAGNTNSFKSSKKIVETIAKETGLLDTDDPKRDEKIALAHAGVDTLRLCTLKKAGEMIGILTKLKEEVLK